MKTLQIKINSTPVVLFFGYACFKNLSEIWNAPGYQAVLNRLGEFGDMKNDITFDQMEMIGDVMTAAIKANPENPECGRNDIMDTLSGNLLLMADVVNALVSAIHKPATPEPPGNVKTVRTKKK